MYMHCNTCGRERPHTYRGTQDLPRGNVETYTCDKCGDMSSIAQSGYVEYSNDGDSGQPVAWWGKGKVTLTPAQERDLVTRDGNWHNGRKQLTSLPVAKKRGLFG